MKVRRRPDYERERPALPESLPGARGALPAGVRASGARWALYALAYVLWALNLALATATLLVARQLVLRSLAFFHLVGHGMTVTDEWMMVFLALTWLVWATVGEHIYRTGAGRGAAGLLDALWRTTLAAGAPLALMALALRLMSPSAR